MENRSWIITSVQAESLDKIVRQQIKEEQGRWIECTFAIPNKDEYPSDIHIAATVTVPESEIVQGDYEQTLISKNQIEEVLLNDQKMESVESSVLEEVWQIASESESNKAFKVDYTIDNGIKKSFYENTSIQNVADIEYTENNCPTQEMKEQLKVLSEKAKGVSEQLGITSYILTTRIGGNNGYYMADV